MASEKLKIYNEKPKGKNHLNKSVWECSFSSALHKWQLDKDLY